MAVLTAGAGQLDAGAIARAARYRVELFDDWKQATARWSETRASTPFQDFRLAWRVVRRVHRESNRVIAVITDARTLEQVALLPLVAPHAPRRAHRRIRRPRSHRLQRAAARSCRAARCGRRAGVVARSDRRADAHARRRRSHPPAQAAARSRRPAQSAGAARGHLPLCCQRQSCDDRRRLRRLAAFAGTQRPQGIFEKLARVQRANPGASFRIVTDPEEALARDGGDGSAAGRADAGAWTELQPERSGLRRLLPRPRRAPICAPATPCSRR